MLVTHWQPSNQASIQPYHAIKELPSYRKVNLIWLQLSCSEVQLLKNRVAETLLYG